MGTVHLDVKTGGKKFDGSINMLVKNVNYKNVSAFELYTHTPVETVHHWNQGKREQVPKTITPSFIRINEESNKKINTPTFFQNDPLKHIETYFPKEAKPSKALIIGFVTSGAKKTYFSRRELKVRSDLNINSVQQIEEIELLDRLYEENYTQNSVLTIKIDTLYTYPNVNVYPREKSDISKNFKHYIHKLGGLANNFNHLALDCRSKCEFKGFTSTEYTKDNLKEVGVYFHESDSYNRVPIVIELKPKSGQKLGSSGTEGKSVYFQLESISENNSEDNPEKWTKNYNKTSVDDLSNNLNEIYNGELKARIDKIIGTGDNSTLIGAVSGSVGTIGAIGTGVGGFFIYKNSAIVITFFKSLF